MPDNLRNTGGRDDARININQDHEVNYWSETLGVSRQELREAVEAAGPMVENVRKYLEQGSRRNSSL